MLKRALALSSLLACTTFPLFAQQRCAPPIAAGSEWERYLRILQIGGALYSDPWSLRPFSPSQAQTLLPRDSATPWAALNPAFMAPIRCLADGRYAAVLQPRIQVVLNSTFPLGFNDGPVWAGRGLTTSMESGISARVRWASVSFAPIVYWTQNADFPTLPTGFAGDRAFADWQNPDDIDLPQRFGDHPFFGFDLGESEARVDLGGVAVGVSTRNAFWGPASEHPIILGNNAAGFPRAFAGTSHPVSVWRLGRVHGHVFWGRLAESKHSPLADSGFSRLGSGIVVVFQPSVLPGLEVGGGRFFHVLQDDFHLNSDELLRPLGNLFKQALSRTGGVEEPENQLASVFARLVFPNDGAEVYAEFGREDHNWNLREFWQFLDHDAAYVLGARKGWRRGDDLFALRAEVLNSRITHLALSSSQAPWYVHEAVKQGHTNGGQALGSVATYGGGASLIAFDRYTRGGRTTFSWERLQLAQDRSDRAPDLRKNDVAHVWRINARRFERGADVELGLAFVYEINRQLRYDAGSFQATLGLAPQSFRGRR